MKKIIASTGMVALGVIAFAPESSGQDSFRAGVDTVTRNTKPVEKQPVQGITKRFKNPKTGQMDTFRLENNKWIPAK